MSVFRPLLAAGSLLALAAPAAAQAPARRPWTFAVGAAPFYVRAQGPLSTYLASGYGFALGVHAAPVGSRLGVAVLSSWLTFRSQTRDRPLYGAAGGPPIAITSGSRIVMVTAGPEGYVSWGRLRVAGTIGLGGAQLSNTGAVDGLGDPARFQRANSYGSVTWAARAGAGLSVRFGPPGTDTRLGIDADYVRMGPAQYLREGNLPSGVISGIYLYPSALRPAFFTVALGVHAGL